jgi:hypothetical protein
MIHDPLCSGPCCEWMPQPCGCQCNCDLITKARQDTLAKCITAVAEFTEKGDSVRPADIMYALQVLEDKP